MGSPIEGGGLSQALIRLCTPPPHIREHVVNGLHAPQFPATGFGAGFVAGAGAFVGGVSRTGIDIRDFLIRHFHFLPKNFCSEYFFHLYIILLSTVRQNSRRNLSHYICCFCIQYKKQSEKIHIYSQDLRW